MFIAGQKVKYITKLGEQEACILAQRVYTNAYTHWDIKVAETNLTHLGIPEHNLQAL